MTLRCAIACALLLVASAACADVSPPSCTLGPWRLGMSRAEVTGFAELGPYTEVRETNGLETTHAARGCVNGTAQFGCAAQSGNLSFEFDDHGLAYLQEFAYEGSDYKAAKSVLLGIFDEFAARYGGAELEDFKVEGPAGAAPLDHQVLDDLLEQVLGEAREVGARTLSEQQSSVSMMFDLAPLQQPCADRVHVQWGYHSKFDTFYVLLYHDRMDAPPRSIDRNFRLGPP